MLLNFATAQPLVHLEHKRSGIFVDKPDDVEVFTHTAETVQAAALDPTRSREFINFIAYQYEEQS
ncbi:MAG: Scr1 family TA system antitoxin-like transcriptional regulator [Pseudomonas sp.]